MKNNTKALFGNERAPTPRKLFLVFNHTFTAAQEEDARRSLGVAEVVPLPDDLRSVWGQIPPDLPEIEPYLAPIRKWVADEGRPGDHVLIQGDFGACHLLVNWAAENGFTPVYATTRREAVETQEPDGSVKMTHHFKHQMFRRYGR